MPANIIDPTVGASTWASGNHIWKGNIGIFIHRAMNKKSQINFSLDCTVSESTIALISNIKNCWSKIIILNKKKIDPINVYKKNMYTACTLRWRDPHIPIIKNIGISVASKQT